MTFTKLVTGVVALILAMNIFSGDIREAFEDWRDTRQVRSSTLFTDWYDLAVADMERSL